MKTLNVDLGERTYPIHIGHNLIDSDLLGSVIKGRHPVVESVVDESEAVKFIENNCIISDII